MTQKHQQIRGRHEFELLQNHEETDHEKDKKIILITIGVIIISLFLLIVMWSYVFSIQSFIRS